MALQAQLEELLTRTFHPLFLSVEDESAQHAGHVGVRAAGGSHFRVTIVSEVFQGRSRLERHRQIYQTVATLEAEIHALALQAWTPEEWSEKKSRVVKDEI